MPALRDTGMHAVVTYLGVVTSRQQGLTSAPRAQVEVGFEGFLGEAHAGLTRPSCARVAALYPRDTEIRNTRQISILDREELAVIAAAIGVERLAPELLGASMVVAGLPDFSHLPPASRLLADNGTCLTLDVQNRPCVLPGREIEARFPGKGKAFKAAARGLRGVTAWVERPGRLALGDRLRLFVPDQRGWRQSPGGQGKRGAGRSGERDGAI